MASVGPSTNTVGKKFMAGPCVRTGLPPKESTITTPSSSCVMELSPELLALRLGASDRKFCSPLFHACADEPSMSALCLGLRAGPKQPEASLQSSMLMSQCQEMHVVPETSHVSHALRLLCDACPCPSKAPQTCRLSDFSSSLVPGDRVLLTSSMPPKLMQSIQQCVPSAIATVAIVCIK